MALFSKSGMARDEVFSRLEAFRQDDVEWQEGRVFGYIFDPGQAAQAVAKQAYSMFLSENGLDFSVFQSLLKLEKELAAIGAIIFGARPRWWVILHPVAPRASFWP